MINNKVGIIEASSPRIAAVRLGFQPLPTWGSLPACLHVALRTCSKTGGHCRRHVWPKALASSPQVRTHPWLPTTTMPEVIAMVKGPEKAYKSLVDIGVDLAAKTLIRVSHQSFYADCYIGFGGMLSIMVAGRLADATNSDPELRRCGALSR